MGIISLSAFSQETSSIHLPYYLIDKFITINDLLMKGKATSSQILNIYPHLNTNETLRERDIPVKKRHFTKWYKMSYTNHRNPFEPLALQILLSDSNDSSLQNSSNDAIPFKTSISEQGMREYHAINKEHYESRVLRAPPFLFRWHSWLITSNVPINRLDEGYLLLQRYPLKQEYNTLIRNTINNYLEQNLLKSNALRESAFNVSKAIVCLDKEIENKETIIALASFMLMISGRNEVEVFYFLMSVLSGTFKENYSLRFLLCRGCPLMNVLLHCYGEMCKKHLKKLMDFLNEKNYSLDNLFEQYFKMCFLNAFSYKNVIRVFDCFVVKGISFFVSLAVSITDFLQKKLLKINDEKEIFDLFTQLSSNQENEESSEVVINIEDIINNALHKYNIKKEDFEREMKNVEPNLDMKYEYDYRNIKKCEEPEEEKEEEEEGENQSQHKSEHRSEHKSEHRSEHMSEHKSEHRSEHNEEENNDYNNVGYGGKTIYTFDLVVDDDGDEESEIVEHLQQIPTNVVSFESSNPFINKKKYKKI